MAPNPLSAQFVQFVYIPSAVLILGALLFKKYLLPFAIAATGILGGIQYALNRNRAPITCFMSCKANVNVEGVPEPKGRKVLDPDVAQEYPISEKTQISHNTAIYRFKLPNETDILGLPIGQHISLGADLDVKNPKTQVLEHKEVFRSYTPISSDVNPGYFDLIVKAYPTGNISRHLATLNVGDKMKVRGPKGAMVYTPNMVRKFGMVAGGTGITPMLQVARAIQRGRKYGDKTEVSLIFANVNEEDILLREDLDQLAREDPLFKIYYVLNNPPANWKGGVGFVTQDMLKERLPSPASNVKILLCGPPPMVIAIKKATEALGFEKARAVSKLEDQVFAF